MRRNATLVVQSRTGGESGSVSLCVSNDKRGRITITDSLTRNNPRGTFEPPDLPGFYVIAKTPAQVVNSQILR